MDLLQGGSYIKSKELIYYSLYSLGFLNNIDQNESLDNSNFNYNYHYFIRKLNIIDIETQIKRTKRNKRSESELSDTEELKSR